MYDYEFPLSDGADIEQTLNMKWDRKNSFNARTLQQKVSICTSPIVYTSFLYASDTNV